VAIPTEPIGSVPRSSELLQAMTQHAAGRITDAELGSAQEQALWDTILRMEETGSPVISDGEQTKPSFVTYPLAGLKNLAPDGVVIPFADGHTRQLPRLGAGPFAYGAHASSYLQAAQRYATRPVKQAVIAASAMGLLYPESGVPGYPREQFVSDLLNEAEHDIRECLEAGAACVQVDFTEARLSLKLDPSGGLLQSFVDLNNRVLERFSEAELSRIGVHTCPGGDRDSTHSADVDYAGLLPRLFEMKVGRFYVQLASEPNRSQVLELLAGLVKPGQTLFVGVIDPIKPAVETAEQVRDRVLEVAKYIPVTELGTTDDCGFSPFADDTSTSREVAFAKIRARVDGTQLAAEALGV